MSIKKRKSVSFLELDSTGKKIPGSDHDERTEPPSAKRPKTNQTANTQAPQRPQHSEHPQHPNPKPNPITQTLLSIYYPQTLTLRQYALSKLPKSSRIRRKKISQVGLSSSSPVSASAPTPGSVPENPSGAAHQRQRQRQHQQELEQALGHLLDTTLVCCSHDDFFSLQKKEKKEEKSKDYRWEQWVSFSQGGGGGGGGGNKGDESHVTLSDGLRGALFSQGDIVDFVVWLLFSRSSARLREKSVTGNGGGKGWPRHLLCDGFRKGVPPQGRSGEVGGGHHQIPGVYAVHPNNCVRTLKETPWPQFLLLLGKEGERIMLDLLLDCAVFVAVKEGKGNLVQVSGIPVSELQPWTTTDSGRKDPKGNTGGENKELSPSEITFARNRMLYARAALNARGLVHFGLRHIRRFSFRRRHMRTNQADDRRRIKPLPVQTTV